MKIFLNFYLRDLVLKAERLSALLRGLSSVGLPPLGGVHGDSDQELTTPAHSRAGQGTRHGERAEVGVLGRWPGGCAARALG